MISKHNIYQAGDSQYSQSTPLYKIAIGAGAAYGIKKIAFDKILNIPVSKLGIHSNIGNLRYLSGYWPGLFTEQEWKQPTIGHYLWNAIRVSEETLLKFPRAISPSTFFGAKILSKGEKILPYEVLRRQVKYLERASNMKITEQLLQQSGGLVYKNGYFYAIGNENVPLMAGKIYPGLSFRGQLYRDGSSAEYLSRHIKAAYGIRGLHAPMDDIIILGDRTKPLAAKRTMDAVLTTAMENYMRLLDDPFEFVKSFITSGATKSTRATKVLDILSGTMGKLGIRNLFGVGGFSEMHFMDWKEIFMKHMKTGFPRMLALFGGIALIDKFLKSFPLFHNTVAGTGLKGIAAKGYQDVSLAYSTISDITGLTDLTKYQESKAPGSTSLLSTFAFSASFGIAGLTLGAIMDLTNKNVSPILGHDMPEWGKYITSEIANKGGSIGRFMKAIGTESMGRKGLYGLIGAAIGALVTIPLLPGKLGSLKSRKEREEEYSGLRRVPIRRNRGWMFGITPFEGGDIKFFAPHWTVRALSRGEEREKTPELFYRHPLLGTIANIIDPYASERLLDKERPYAYWGATDYGLGFVEELFKPLKFLRKPTLLAHPEGLYGGEPSSPGEGGAGSLYSDFTGYLPTPQTPDSLQGTAYSLYSSAQEAMGFFGFMGGAAIEHVTGIKHPFQPLAQYVSSGNITSASRGFWDQDLADMLGANEAYRRLNWHRDYGTEHLTSTLRNTQPSWIPEKYQYGDPFASIQLGEIRLPGRGLSAIYPDLEGINPENYPDIYKLMVLNDVAPDSREFADLFTNLYQQSQQGDLSEESQAMLDEIIRERKLKYKRQQFDYGDGILGSYYLFLKKIGRALPTESLFPIAPVHKFAGPVDPATEYKDKYLLDNEYKDWAHPIESFVKPAIYKTLDDLSLVGFTPSSPQEVFENDIYFQALQNKKNEYLEEQAQYYESIGSPELAKYYRSKVKTTIYDIAPTASADEILAEYSNQKRYYLAGAMQREYSPALDYVSPDMQAILAAQWQKEAAGIPLEADINGPSIGEAIPIQVDESDLPEKDYITYAPGVDLNAFKVKTIDRMGENIRKYDLWKKDEIAAMALDARNDIEQIQAPRISTPYDAAVRMDQYLINHDILPNIAALPTGYMPQNSIYLRSNDRKKIKKKMQEEGWVIRPGGYY